MKLTLREIIKLTKNSKNHSVKMQNRLLLYWGVMMFAFFAAILVILSFAGVFSNAEEKALQILCLQEKNSYAELSEQFSTLTAKGIVLSEKSSEIIENIIFPKGISSLDNSPKDLEIIQTILYGELDTILNSSPCNGAYIIFNATTNTKAPNAEKSKAGIYLRVVNISGKNEIDTDLVLFRGIPAVARKNDIELHNRWKLEFDVSNFPGYETAFNSSGTRISEECFWTEKTVLPQTWENMVLLRIPIIGKDGSVYGVCGIEISELYFRLFHPAMESELGGIVTVIAPIKEDELMVSKGIVGGIEGTKLRSGEDLIIKEGESFNTYIGRDSSFIGLHQKLDIKLEGESEVYAVTLLPEEYYLKEEQSGRIVWIISTVILFITLIFASFFLTKKFVKPIVESLENIKSEKVSGISEIDTLLAFIREKEKDKGKQKLPEDIEELFAEFFERAKALTPTEKTIIRYYAEGKEINEIPELCFISINTVRKHNANIYQKLEVGSREELLLYIELFRRSGRLDQLF